VHLLISAHPNLKLSDLVNNLKTASYPKAIHRTVKRRGLTPHWRSPKDRERGPEMGFKGCREG